MKENSVIKIVYMSTVYLFLYLPLIILIVLSFNNVHMSFEWHGFTWQWYQALLSDDQLHSALYHSLCIGILSASIATSIGTLGALALYRYRFLGKNFLYALVFALIIAPDLVMGISLLLFFSALKIYLGFFTLLIAHITFCVPFVVVMVYGRLTGFNRYLLEAARDLGANDYLTFTKIILPLLKPAILGAWLVSFALSIDDLVISFFVTGPSFQVLPLYIYSQVRIGPTPEINALCTVLIAATFIIVLLAQWALKRKS
jgi:spermidine/putrescine transport system permease protein